MPEKTREWVDYADVRQGDQIVDHRHGQLLVDRPAPEIVLPDAAYTVILATFRDAVDKRAYVLTEAGRWSPVPDGMGYPPMWMAERITGFEVLAEPRAVTAKAVIDRVRAIVGVPFGAKGWPEVVGNEFGVTS